MLSYFCISGANALSCMQNNFRFQGNYVFDELPPGFYVINAQLGDKLKYQSHYIKVLPGQSVNHPILLNDISF